MSFQRTRWMLSFPRDFGNSVRFGLIHGIVASGPLNSVPLGGTWSAVEKWRQCHLRLF